MHQIAKELSKIQNKIEHSELLELAVHDQNENISGFFYFFEFINICFLNKMSEKAGG